MTLIFFAFLSGILTVLAPCVLPLLPIILGSSLEKQKYGSAIVIASLSVSIFIFSLLLKTTTLFIEVPGGFWKSISGGILVIVGLFTLFPGIWKTISTKLGFSQKSNALLAEGNSKTGVLRYIFLGAALGPVFSSCSPTYALILAIVLPASYILGINALLSYIFGLAFVLGLIAYFGQKFSSKLKAFANPKGYFQKILGVIFLLIGLSIITGIDKKIETKILDSGFLNTTNFEQSIIDSLNLENVEAKETGTESEKERDIIQKAGTFFGKGPENVCAGGKCEKRGIPYSSGSIIGFQAPDLVGLENWINTSANIDSLQQLHGSVVMIDFWTLGCINCINTHKDTNKLYEEFKTQGLEILGLHTPEFAYEQKIENLKKAVDEFEIQFPVAQDNDFKTWRAYNNRYWPAFYIIDKQGIVRYTHFGEGGYEKKREIIQELLAE